MNALPGLRMNDWRPTRDTLREICLVLSALQRAFLPKHPRQWQYGLEVNLRGVATQEFTVNGEPMRATLDLVRHKVRWAGEWWSLRENPPAQILANFKDWLNQQGIKVELDEPEFTVGVLEYDQAQANDYAAALWWLSDQFQQLKSNLTDGETAPVLLYPHHFDLSLVWFPFDTGSNDERQVAIGWSTGDETIKESYIYLTAYPEPTGFTDLTLPKGAHWQKQGFSGAILPYGELVKSSNPAELFKGFASVMPKTGNLLQL